MGNEFYTSPETSRALAEAGLDQSGVGAWWRPYVDVPALSIGERPRMFVAEDTTVVSPDAHRALRLDEVLHEIKSLGVRQVRFHMLSDDPEAWLFAIQSKHATTAATPVEAAAEVLLALLRERGGK